MTFHARDFRDHVMREWGLGKTEAQIAAALGVSVHVVAGVVQRSHGPDAERARLDHRWNRAAMGPAFYRGKDSIDREARVLPLWADGWSATDIARQLGERTRNTVIGVVNRSRGEFAEEAKRAHAAAAALRYPKWSPRWKRVLPEPAQRNRVVSAGAMAAQREKCEEVKSVLTGQALVDHKAQCKVKQLATIAKVEAEARKLTLINNLAFVAKVEKPFDPYSHMRTDKGYHAAIAALTR